MRGEKGMRRREWGSRPVAATRMKFFNGRVGPFHTSSVSGVWVGYVEFVWRRGY